MKTAAALQRVILAAITASPPETATLIVNMLLATWVMEKASEVEPRETIELADAGAQAIKICEALNEDVSNFWKEFFSGKGETT